jgi:arsenate reductase (thioredoxin)
MPSRCNYFLWIVSLLVSAPLFSQGPNPSPDAAPKVLFVCEHGAAKSIIATAHFNELAEKRGLPHRAVARGTQPDAAFSPKAVSGLQSEGFAPPDGKPTLVSDKDVSGAARVVTLGCKLPQKTAVTDWADVPSPSEDYSAASDAIKKHVEALINELSRKEPKP